MYKKAVAVKNDATAFCLLYHYYCVTYFDPSGKQPTGKETSPIVAPPYVKTVSLHPLHF